MNEVKKWYIGVYGGEAQARGCTPHVREIIRESEGEIFVLAREFDRVTAERDALQLLLNETLMQRPQGEPVAYDPAKENKQFEAWARTQSQVDLRLCDIGLYYERQTGLAHDAWQHRAKTEQQSAPAAVVPELTSELRWILGQMCFQHIHTAQALRLMGHQIARKAEDEQAVTIHWMLGHYLKDPANWRKNASAEMKAAAPAA